MQPPLIDLYQPDLGSESGEEIVHINGEALWETHYHDRLAGIQRGQVGKTFVGLENEAEICDVPPVDPEVSSVHECFESASWRSQEPVTSKARRILRTASSLPSTPIRS